MDKVVFFHAAFIIVSAFLGAVSQVLLKKSAMKEYRNKIEEYLNPFVIIAYCIFFASTFLNIFAYKGIPLSMGPILEATSYIYVTIFGVKIFKEKLTKRKCIALVLIISGIVVYSLMG